MENSRPLAACICIIDSANAGGSSLPPVVQTGAYIEKGVEHQRYEVTSDVMEGVIHSGNTSPEEILKYWEENGFYIHDPTKVMKNVFPKGSFAHDYCNELNLRYHNVKPDVVRFWVRPTPGGLEQEQKAHKAE